jgi:hypothetical protein
LRELWAKSPTVSRVRRVLTRLQVFYGFEADRAAA